MIEILTEEQKALITRPTPPDCVEFRRGRGNTQLAYVKINYAIRALNEVFGFNWSVTHGEPMILEDVKEVLVPTTLSIFAGDTTLIKQQYGRDDIATNREGAVISIGDAIKSAASDGLKKCCSLLGMFADLYAGEVTQQTVRAAEAAQRTANTAGQTATQTPPPAQAEAPAAEIELIPMPEVNTPENAQDGLTTLLEVAEEHFGLSPQTTRDILSDNRMRPSQLPGQFSAMLEVLRHHASQARAQAA